MKKIFITAGLLVSMMFRTVAQETTQDENYQKRKLKIEEINFVTSYYHQEGNKSAVTGGEGTEKLSDYANSFDLKVSKYDIYNRQHTFNLDFNIDYYTSASSDNIDFSYDQGATRSGASGADIHVYPTISWSMKDNRTRMTQGLSYSFSREYDYQSHGVTANWGIASKDNNREFSVKGSAFLDRASIILPTELRTNTGGNGRGGLETRPRNSFGLTLSLSQVINERLQMILVADPSYQEGFLSTSFHRVYFTDNSLTIEKLPGNRIKLPIGIRANYFFGDNAVLRTFYRYYMDDWGMTAHTINLEGSYKITPFISLTPFYRFNSQTAVKYFAEKGQHAPTATYYTSDYDISGMNTNFFGGGFRYAPVNGVLGMQHFASIELRYGHYTRTTDMVANIITMHLKMK
jgi:Protein of unknown function (DUF3570)